MFTRIYLKQGKPSNHFLQCSRRRYNAVDNTISNGHLVEGLKYNAILLRRYNAEVYGVICKVLLGKEQ